MRSVAILVLVAALAALAAGCGDDSDSDPGSDSGRSPAVAADEAQAEYGAVVRDVAAALATAADTTTTNDARTVYGKGDDGVCEFWSAKYELPVWFGDDVDWDDVRATVEEAVPAGWTVGDDLDIPGGFTGFDATEDDTGAVLQVRAKGTSTVRVVAPVTGVCGGDASTSPLPAPS
jgi:hypothetical protein